MDGNVAQGKENKKYIGKKGSEKLGCVALSCRAA